MGGAGERWVATAVSDTCCSLRDWVQCDYQGKENSSEVMNGLFKSLVGPCTQPQHADLCSSF